MKPLTITQQAAVALLMASAMAEELLDTLDVRGHKLTPVEDNAAALNAQIADETAARVGLTPEQQFSALDAGSRMAEQAMRPLAEVTPTSHQLTATPDRTLN